MNARRLSLTFPASFLFVLLLAALVLTTGCRQSEKEFKEAVETYHNALTDGNIDFAGMSVDAREQTRFFQDMESWLKNRRISSYFIRRVVFNSDNTQATVTVVREYFDNNQMVVKTKNLVQLWEKRRRNWVLVRGDF